MDAAFAAKRFFLEDLRYTNEIRDKNGAFSEEMIGELALRLGSEFGEKEKKEKIAMYQSYYYCALVGMGKNLPPTYGNIIALARNTERFEEGDIRKMSEEEHCDMTLPKYGLFGIAESVCGLFDKNVLLDSPLYINNEYPPDGLDYAEFCCRYGYDEKFREDDIGFLPDAIDSNEYFFKNREQWGDNLSAFVPDSQKFVEEFKRFMELFFKFGDFKADDVAAAIRVHLYRTGKSVFSPLTAEGAYSLLGQLQMLSSDVSSLRDVPEDENPPEYNSLLDGLGEKLENQISNQSEWIKKTVLDVEKSFSGMNINFIMLIQGETPEETERRINALIGMISECRNRLKPLSDSEREMLECFLYCAFWESIAIRGYYSFANCETFGDLLKRADMARKYEMYSREGSGTGIHFEGDVSDEDPILSGAFFDRDKYAACSKRLRELIPDKTTDDENEEFGNDYWELAFNLGDFINLITSSINAFMYCNGLSVFAFTEDFEIIPRAVRNIFRNTGRRLEGMLKAVANAIERDAKAGK